ncbi:MAG: hypothetical protein KEFWMYNX_000586 [Candidatus Fervidibacter sp.]
MHWSASFRSKFKTADETQLGVSAAIKPEGDIRSPRNAATEPYCQTKLRLWAKAWEGSKKANMAATRFAITT